MTPLDGLKRASKKDRIYRSKNRVNFLAGSPKSKIDQHSEIEKPSIKPPQKTMSDISKIDRPDMPKHNFIKIFLIILLIILISGAMYLSERLFAPDESVMAGLNKFNPFAHLARLMTSDEKNVDGELDDRVNILALGIGGAGHDGPYLTDTIIAMSIKPSTGEVGLISIPRDMIVKLRDNQWYKINQVYSMGKVQKKDQSAEYIIEAVEDTLGINLHYYGLITFLGFEEFIDEIGGISIDIPTGFTDNNFPTDDYKTTTVSFTKGLQTLYGKSALTYARSRYGDNFEGSDFARSRRQQLILQSIRDKLFKFSTLLSPGKISAIFDLLGNSIETNMSIWQSIKIVNMVKNTAEDKIYRIVLDDMPDSILEPSFTEEGAWILQPKDKNFDTLARQFNNIFNTGIIKNEAAKIEILNGTQTGGLAYWSTVYLEKLNYNIISYANAPSQDYQRTVIYDLSDGNKKKTLKWLKEELSAYQVKPIPDYFIEKYSNVATSTEETLTEKPDFIIILGEDHATDFKLPEFDSTSTSTEDLLDEETPPTIIEEMFE